MQQWSWSELPRLLRVVAQCRPHVVNIHFTSVIYHDHPMITFLPSILKRLFRGLTVVTLFEYPAGVNLSRSLVSTRLVRRAIKHWVGSNNVDWGYGTLLRDSDRLVVLSDEHRNILTRHLPSADKKTVVIPPPPLLRVCNDENGAARRRGRERLGVGIHEFLIAYYGYLFPGKGIETLLEAIHLANQGDKDIYLVLVGGSNEVMLRSQNRPQYAQELERLSEQLQIADKVRFTGYYPSESDYGSLCLRAADVCILPFDDGVRMNNSSVAAAALHGLPIITTKGALLEAPFIDKENVLLCPPKDPEALARAIVSLIYEPELSRRLQNGATKMAHEWFSWERAVSSVIETFSCVNSVRPLGKKCR
jgi:glycosyltransferase involved in cell wall biosynthesis